MNRIAVKGGSEPTFRDCAIHEGMQCGAYFYEKGRGLLERCDIYGNGYAGVEVRHEADPVVRGQTASSSYKPGKLDNGRRVMIPPYIEAGTRIVVSTADGSYMERAKD